MTHRVPWPGFALRGRPLCPSHPEGRCQHSGGQARLCRSMTTVRASSVPQRVLGTRWVSGPRFEDGCVTQRLAYYMEGGGLDGAFGVSRPGRKSGVGTCTSLFCLIRDSGIIHVPCTPVPVQTRDRSQNDSLRALRSSASCPPLPLPGRAGRNADGGERWLQLRLPRRSPSARHFFSAIHQVQTGPPPTSPSLSLGSTPGRPRGRVGSSEACPPGPAPQYTSCCLG